MTEKYPPVSRAKAQVIATLSQKKMRRKHCLFVVEGHKSVVDTLGKFNLFMLVATPEWLESEGHNLISELRIERSMVFSATQREIDSMSSLSTPSEVMAVYRLPESPDGSDMMRLDPGLYLLLDGIQDPGNLGTIIRTAHWFGINRIYASRATADIFNPKTIQSTMGSLAEVEVVYTDLPALVDANPDFSLVGLLLEGEDIFSTPLPQSAFIAMGNEGNGLTPEMRERVNKPLTIPPANAANHPDSLNVAIATAITLAQFKK